MRLVELVKENWRCWVAYLAGVLSYLAVVLCGVLLIGWAFGVPLGGCPVLVALAVFFGAVDRRGVALGKWVAKKVGSDYSCEDCCEEECHEECETDCNKCE